MTSMVNGIDRNNPYQYSQLKNVNVSDSDEQFSLHYGQDTLSPEPKDKKDKTDGQKKPQTVEQSGVKLELSGSAQAAQYTSARRQATANSSAAGEQPSLLETIQNFFTTAVAAIKDFFYKLWNDEPAAVEETSQTADVETAQTIEASVTDESAVSDAEAFSPKSEEQLNREIQPYLRSGNLPQVLNLLTDNGKKTIAKNSSLLTYYDRNGRMVEPNASDRERILHGDRNTRKL